MTDVTSEQLFEAIQSFDHDQAKQIFTQFLSKLDQILDSQNATLLHVASNYNNHQIIIFFLQSYDKMAANQPTLYSGQRKKEWLNKKDNEGFTCIHYAVFRGNSELAFLLQQHGADIYAINKQGLTVLHIAAQGDSPLLMHCYLNKGMKISTEDAKGSTPLHWACYSGQQNSAYALLAWGAEIDKQDFTYGMTPLHLAVMSGNGRIVKKLLVHGCDRNIKNYNNRLALDIARQNEYKNITQMIVDKRGLQEFFNIKTPYRLIGKFTIPFYFLIFVFLSNYILNVSFVLFQHFPQGGELAFIYLIFGIVVACLFLITSRKKPGYIKIDSSQNDFEVLQKNHPSKICFQCMVVKPQRSRHCQICHHCVSVYDHHCPWVANCVGSKNYLWFFLFLLGMQSFMIFTIIFQTINITNMDWDNTSPLELIRMICVVYGLLCSSFFLLPLSYLLYVQITNCLSNQSTFERYGYQNKINTPSKTTTQKTQSLQQHLIVKANSKISSQISGKNGEKAITVRLQAQVETDRLSNCYKMCWTNADNVAYQVGKCS